MANWVLPGILKVEEVAGIDVALLEMMSNISTGVIVGYINKFIEGNINSSDPVASAAAAKLQAAYDKVNRVTEYLNSEEAKNLADTLCSLQYSDVSAELPLEKLVSYRSTILDLLSEDKDFVESYQKEIAQAASNGMKTAYTPKLDCDNFDAVLSEMRAYLKDKPGSMISGSLLITHIENNQRLFINSRAKINSPTVLRKAIYKKDRLKSILRGLDFLIEKKTLGESPRSWRII